MVNNGGETAFLSDHQSGFLSRVKGTDRERERREGERGESGRERAGERDRD